VIFAAGRVAGGEKIGRGFGTPERSRRKTITWESLLASVMAGSRMNGLFNME
jgi:hypothetical protein